MIYMTMIASMLLLIYKKSKRFGIQNRKKDAHCHGNSGYDYRYIYHFAGGNPELSF